MDWNKNLIDAVCEDKPEKIEEALKAGASLNTIVPPELYHEWKDLPLLHYTVLKDAKGLVRMLVNKGADINAVDGVGRTPLHYIKDVGTIRFFLKKGASPYILDRNGFSPVFSAVCTNKTEVMDVFNEMGVDLKRVDTSGNTLLHIALALGYNKVISWLLDNGADVKVKNQWGRTPKDVADDLNYNSRVLEVLGGAKWKGLHDPGLFRSRLAKLIAAVHFKDNNEVKWLLDSGMSPNALVPPEICNSASSQTVLQYALKRHATLIVYYLVNKGADIKRKDEDGRTPLHCAVIYNDSDSISYLIKKGASSQALDAQGKSPFCYAINNNSVDILENLCQNEEVNFNRRDEFGNTYLHQALANGAGRVIPWLLKKSDNVEVKNQWDCTPKDLAKIFGYRKQVLSGSQKLGSSRLPCRIQLFRNIRFKNAEAVQKLLDSGESSNVNVPPELTHGIMGQSALHYAIQNKAAKVAEVLICRGADIEATDIEGRTPLHYAVIYYCHSAVELLLNKKASPFEVDEKGLSAICYAVCGNNILALHMLQQNGIDFSDLKDKSGKTYLQLAKDKNQTDVVEWLEKKHKIEECVEYAPENIEQDLNHNQKLEICDLSEEERQDIPSSGIKDKDKCLFDALKKNKITSVSKALRKGASPVALLPEMPGSITPLHYAAQHCSKLVVKELIKTGGSLESRDGNDEVPLHSAVRAGQHEIVEYLMSQGADAHATNKEGQTPVTLAVITGSVQILKIFKKNKIDISAKDRNGNTYLHHAWAHDQGLKTVCWLLENKISVTEKNNFGRTVDDVAKDMGYNMQLVKLLNNPKKKGSVPVLKTPVFIKLLDAVVNNKADEVNDALGEGASPSVLVPPERSGCMGVTVLLYAIHHGSLHAVKALMKAGIDLNAKDMHGETSLHLAVRQEKLKAVEFLLSQGVDPHVQNNQGKTPVILAIQDGFIPILEIFIKNGVDVNSTDKLGSTYLHHALAYCQNAETICWLLEKNICRDKVNQFCRTAQDVAKNMGYDSSFIKFLGSSEKMDSVLEIRIPVLVKLLIAVQRNEAIEVAKLLKEKTLTEAMVPPELLCSQEVTTILHYAAQWSSKKVLKELIKAGGDVDRRDGQGEVPLHMAVQGRNVDTFEYLIDQGADPNIVNQKGVSPKILASQKGCGPILEILKKQR